MGKLSERDLRRLLDPPKVGSVVSVGAAGAAPRTTATAIRQKEDGRWYYTDEVPIQIWPNRFLEIPLGDGHLVWMGLEVKTNQLDWKRKQLVFSMKPYSLNWYGQGEFRPAAKSKAAAAGMIRKAYRKTNDWLTAVESIAYDPFETNRKWLTARLRNPMRLHWEGFQPLGQQFAYGRSVNYSFGAKGTHDKPEWMFAVCEDFPRAVEEIKTELGSDPKITRDLPMEPAGIFDSTLTASIQQALAGRAGGSADNRVVYTAARIFRNHMEAAAKRSGAAPR